MSEEIDTWNENSGHKIQLKWERLLEILESLPCETEEQQAWWAHMLEEVHAALKILDDRRLERVRPLLETKKEVDKKFQAYSVPGEKAKIIIQAKLEAAALARRQAQVVLAAILEEKAKEGDVEGYHETAQALAAPQIKDSNRTTYAWGYYLADETQVPREFLCLDHRAVEKYCKKYSKHESIPPVPGLTFHRTSKVAPTGKR